jgi:hypothetical protein
MDPEGSAMMLVLQGTSTTCTAGIGGFKVHPGKVAALPAWVLRYKGSLAEYI